MSKEKPSTPPPQNRKNHTPPAENIPIKQHIILPAYLENILHNRRYLVWCDWHIPHGRAIRTTVLAPDLRNVFKTSQRGDESPIWFDIEYHSNLPAHQSSGQTVPQEWRLRIPQPTRAGMKQEVIDDIRHYNSGRGHTSHGGISPVLHKHIINRQIHELDCSLCGNQLRA